MPELFETVRGEIMCIITESGASKRLQAASSRATNGSDKGLSWYFRGSPGLFA